MPRWIVKVGRYKDQVRITIPKALAVESSLFEARLAELRLSGVKRLEVIVFEEGWHGEGMGKGDQS